METGAFRRSEPEDHHFRLLVESVVDYAIFMLDPTGCIISWNEGARRMKGYADDEIIGQHMSVFYPPEALEVRRPWRLLEAAVQHGRAEDAGWRVRKDGSRFWANVVITALWSESGELKGFAKVTRDLTERRMRAEMETANRRLTFLAQVSEALAASLASPATLRDVVQLAVQHNADWCTLLLLNADGTVRELLSSHRDPERLPRVAEFLAMTARQPVRSGAIWSVARTGQAEVYPDISPSQLVSVAGSEDASRLVMTAGGMRSAMVVPLIARGQALGALQMVWAQEHRRYDEADLTMAQEVARRAALAIDNADLFREAQEASQRRDESYALLASQNAISEAIAQGQPLSSVLRLLTHFIEEWSPSAWCAIHLLDADGTILRCSASGRMPPSFRAGIEVVEVGPNAAACGAAAYRRESLQLPEGWATPVFGSQREVIGTVTLHYPGADGPTQLDRRLVSISTHLLAIAIERNRAQEARDMKLQTLVTHMGEGLVAIDNEGRVLVANPTVHELLGCSGPVQGSMLADAGLPSDLQESLLWASGAECHAPFQVMLTWGQREIEAHVSPVATDNGRYGALALLRDVTMEVRLRRLQNSFVANVSHELKGPLASVSAVVEALRDGLIAPANRGRYMASLLAEIGRLQRLTDQLLQLSKLEAGVVDLPKGPVDLAELLGVVGQLWQYQCRDAGLTLSVDSPRLMVSTNFDALEQVIINLVENAVRFTPPGGSISLRAHQVDHLARIEVEDSGGGIPPEHIRLIWEPFYKVDQARTLMPNSGTGLGLSIVKRLVAQMGGEIRVESEVGRGTVFAVLLPLAEPQ